MEKDLPPPYSAATGTHPLPGFAPPPSHPSEPYSTQHGYPPPQQGYPPPQQGYPMPQQGYPQPQQPYTIPPGQGSTTVVVTTIPVASAFGPGPQPTTCPHCHRQITTRVENEPGMRTHIIALVCCLMGCIPCCLIPYCMDSCQTRTHYCPGCGAYLGNYNDLNDMGRRW